MGEIVWEPQAKQIAFLERPEYECLYGGAAGGGKSDALLMEALRQVDNPDYRALILRKTYPQLSELIDRSGALYPLVFPGARYNDSKHLWLFPSGAKITFGSMQFSKDRANYQGRRFDFIAFDELTHFTWEEYSYMFSRNRPSRRPSSTRRTRVYMRAATNPGGIGHGWVKERFIAPAPPMTPISETQTILDPTGKKISITRDRIFIPATVFDNAALLESGSAYLGSLSLLPAAEREALLYGSWDSFSGQVFREWRDDPAHYVDRKWTHVIKPFQIPKRWKCWRSYDFGYTRPYSIGWYVADEDGKLYRIRELYGCTAQANTGVQENPAEIARQIREIEETDPLLQGRDIIGVADPSIFDESRGQSIAAMMMAAPHFIVFHRADNQRLPGKMQFHYRLAFDAEGECLFQVFDTCRHFIRTIPALAYSTRQVEDIDTDGEDHCLVGETLVWTEKGKVPIRDLVGTTGRVVSSDGEYHRYSGVRQTVSNARVFTLEMEDGSTVTATATHRFLLADGSWKRLSEIVEGDDLWTVR